MIGSVAQSIKSVIWYIMISYSVFEGGKKACTLETKVSLRCTMHDVTFMSNFLSKTLYKSNSTLHIML